VAVKGGERAQALTERTPAQRLIGE
jgi:hypothetical protein